MPQANWETVVLPMSIARDDGKVVDDARERRNEELLARLHGDEEAPAKMKSCPADDAPEVVARSRIAGSSVDGGSVMRARASR